MSRIHFTSTEEFGRWLQDRSPGKYELYRLNSRTIAVPTVSTRPVLYGVLEERIPDAVADSLREQGYGPIYETTEFRFKSGEAERRSDQD